MKKDEYIYEKDDDIHNLLLSAIKKQNKIVSKACKDLETIANFDISEMNVEYWDEITTTILKDDSDILKYIVKNIFPEAEKISDNYDAVIFALPCGQKSYHFSITKGSHKDIQNIDREKMADIYFLMNEKIRKPKTLDERIQNNKTIQTFKQYIELIKNKASWKEKAKLRYNGEKNKSLVFLFFWWTFHCKVKDFVENRDIVWFEDKLDSLIKEATISYENELKYFNNSLIYWKTYFDNIEPIIHKFTKNIRIKGYTQYDSDIYFNDVKKMIADYEKENGVLNLCN